jgi:predicted negative regulator of RcsB-dependent stress response
MASPQTSTAKPRGDDDALENLIEWAQVNTKAIGIGVVVVVLGIGLYFVIHQTAINKESNAERDYFNAQRSVQAGNLALAQSDLEKMLPRYTGTHSGTLGALLLAQLQFQAGKFPEGIKTLEGAAVTAPASMVSSVRGLIGAGYIDQQKYPEAAKAYLQAADEAAFPAEQETFRAEAARAYAMAGNSADALKLWKAIAENPDSPRSAEARVRVGELTAAAAGK